jgi:hypothetical protein
MPEANVKQVKDFFEESNTAKFSKEWKELSEEEKRQLKEGIGNGTLTY